MTMPLLIDAAPAHGYLIGDWHKCFAWIPVRTYDHRWVWLNHVWRRRCILKSYLQRTGREEWWVYTLDEKNYDR